MKKESTYGNLSTSWADFEKFHDTSKIPWKETKEDIWKGFEHQLKHEPTRVFFRQENPVLRFAFAAVLVLLLGITGVIRFYSHTFEAGPGQHLSILLPDGSMVELNADSDLKYYPLWWSFERKLSLQGEAFFEVKKGNKFLVKSANGQTQVMGTSFNIYSRENDYRVNCLTGKVQVAASKNNVILLPNEQAMLNEKGSFDVKTDLQGQNITSWINNEFFFTSTPIWEVIDEIERQYGVKILLDDSLQLVYTGNFSRDQSVEEVLNLLCRSFGVNFVKNQKGEYQIIQDK